MILKIKIYYTNIFLKKLKNNHYNNTMYPLLPKMIISFALNIKSSGGHTRTSIIIPHTTSDQQQ
jgi:hypothetical protein